MQLKRRITSSLPEQVVLFYIIPYQLMRSSESLKARPKPSQHVIPTEAIL